MKKWFAKTASSTPSTFHSKVDIRTYTTKTVVSVSDEKAKHIERITRDALKAFRKKQTLKIDTP